MRVLAGLIMLGLAWSLRLSCSSPARSSRSRGPRITHTRSCLTSDSGPRAIRVQRLRQGGDRQSRTARQCAPGGADPLAERRILNANQRVRTARDQRHCRANTADRTYVLSIRAFQLHRRQCAANAQACKFGCLGSETASARASSMRARDDGLSRSTTPSAPAAAPARRPARET